MRHANPFPDLLDGSWRNNNPSQLDYYPFTASTLPLQGPVPTVRRKVCRGPRLPTTRGLEDHP